MENNQKQTEATKTASAAASKNKKIQFVCQSKGGVGKSILTYLLALKYPNAAITDMDDATKTTMRQLAFRSPQHISFLNKYNMIDRAMFNEFIESIAASKTNHIVCDLGASVSEQLPYYFRDIKAPAVASMLESVGLSLSLICVVGGSDIFSSTMNYLQELVTVVKGAFPLTIAVNEFHEMVPAQKNQVNEFAKAHNLKVISFNISEDGSPNTQERIKDILDKGQGITDDVPMFSKFFFTEAISNLQL